MNLLIIISAQYLYLLVIAAIAIAWWLSPKNIKKQFLLSIILAGAIAFILSRIASRLYYDPRPFVTEHVKPLIPHAADNGFPSDHALLTGTLTAITYFFKKNIANIMLALTVIIGIARVLAKVHSPLDIAGGWIFGIIGSVAGYYLARYIVTKYIARAPAK